MQCSRGAALLIAVVIKLQIAQNDPYLRPDNEPSTLTFSHVPLRLPTRQIGARTLPPA